LPKLPCCVHSVPQLTHLLSVAAEKVTSLGKDWHRPCLRCEKCNKTLTSGGHAEHDGKPYCNHPCYAALFGPKGFGRGGAESHTFK
ncbi:CRIP1 protein, partial [Pluvianellus socialis]|nr:CRIP1 protein [Pluvianellus socialis]